VTKTACSSETSAHAEIYSVKRYETLLSIFNTETSVETLTKVSRLLERGVAGTAVPDVSKVP
jgi:hypothetical protein